MSKTTSVTGGAFPCPVKGCGRAFISKPALTMHNNRVHSKLVRVPGQKTKMSEEERLAKKRAYNRKWRIRKGMKVRPLAQKEPKQNGAVWTPERRAKFDSTWRSKNKAKLKAKLDKSNSRLEARLEQINKETLPDPRQFINCCPNCGYNLKAHYLAAGFKAP